MRSIQSESGSALLEFSLTMPIIVLFFLGIVDLGLISVQAMTVNKAAEAGTLYGTLAGNNNDIPGMQNAATVTANGLSGFQATATTWCSCTSAGGHVSCTASCSNSASPMQYVQVQTSAPVSLAVNFPGLSSSMQLSGFSVLRVQ